MSTLIHVVLTAVAVLGLAILAGYAITVYNSLVRVRENLEKAWHNISVLLQQRHDELLKLVQACRGYMRHEEKVLLEITRLRSQYDEATTIAAKTRAENRLNFHAHGLFMRAENYPELKASQVFLQLQDRVSTLESSIADRREFFNESVRINNIAVERFPESIVASLFSYETQEYLEVPEAAKQDVELDLGG